MSDANTGTQAAAGVSAPLLEVRGLKKHYPVQGGLLRKTAGYVHAVDDLHFSVADGRTLGIVGESGCGKTTAVRAMIRLYEPTSGEVLFRTRALAHSGEERVVNIAQLSAHELKAVRREISMVFQDPAGSLNPRMPAFEIISEPLRIHGMHESGSRDRIVSLATRVGLRPEQLSRYPHEFSGGQRQRIGIARALALNPRLVICDEPVSALDVSIQAQTLNLLQDLQTERNLAFIFVAHDLSVVEHISDRVAVMYLGRIVEMADVEPLFACPKHPYTEALLSSVPRISGRKDRILMKGNVPDPSDPPPGCHFHPRCRYAKDICAKQVPALGIAGEGRIAACHRADELRLAGV
jgi:peptide/nickel transport system ATP-binding protein